MSSRINLKVPFQRDRNSDFALVSGNALNAQDVRCAMAILQGELPWDTELGSKLHTLRHTSPDATTLALATSYVASDLTHALPNIGLATADVRTDGPLLIIEVQLAREAGDQEQMQVVWESFDA